MRMVITKPAFFLILFMCLGAIDAYPRQVAQVQEQRLPYSRVFVLNPCIVYEDARNEQNLENVDPAAQLVFDDLSPQWASDAFSMTGIGVVFPSSLTEAQMNSIKESYGLLDKGAEDLVKQWKDKAQYLKAFRAIYNVSNADCMLVQFVKVKVGEAGSWDFVYSGAITPGTSTTSIKAVLIDLRTGKISWSGSSIERAMPDKHVVKRLYSSMYGGLPGYKKGGKR